MQVGRNDSCPCGSGKKYKKCCITREQIKPASQRLKNVKVIQSQSKLDTLFQNASVQEKIVKEETQKREKELKEQVETKKVKDSSAKSNQGKKP